MPDNGSILVFGKCVGANDDVVELVSRVKVTPASQICGSPPVALEKWLDTQPGTDAAIAWVVRTADVSLHGRPTLVIMMTAGTSQAGIRT